MNLHSQFWVCWVCVLNNAFPIFCNLLPKFWTFAHISPYLLCYMFGQFYRDFSPALFSPSLLVPRPRVRQPGGGQPVLVEVGHGHGVGKRLARTQMVHQSHYLALIQLPVSRGLFTGVRTITANT